MLNITNEKGVFLMAVSPVNNLNQSRLTSFGNNKAKPNSPHVMPQLSASDEASKKAPIAFKQVRKALAGVLLGAATLFGASGCTSPIFYMIENEGKTQPVQTPPTKPMLTTLGKKMVALAMAFNPVVDSLPSETDRLQTLEYGSEYGLGCKLTYLSESADQMNFKVDYTDTNGPTGITDTAIVTETEKGLKLATVNSGEGMEYIVLPDGTMEERSLIDGSLYATFKPDSKPGTLLGTFQDTEGDEYFKVLNIKAKFSKLVSKLMNNPKTLIHLG